VTPSVYFLEETLSTLDYAHCAKNIKNKPEVNQKMMKSALIKVLYAETSKLKQEVYAAREKNGIYLPSERFLQDEAKKRAMTEKIEQLEVEIDAKNKQIEELQGLYNYRQLLSEEFSNKLEMTQKKLVDTEYALDDLEEKYSQFSCALKEKEFIISNML
jgi:kinesin family protein 11